MPLTTSQDLQDASIVIVQMLKQNSAKVRHCSRPGSHLAHTTGAGQRQCGRAVQLGRGHVHLPQCRQGGRAQNRGAARCRGAAQDCNQGKGFRSGAAGGCADQAGCYAGQSYLHHIFSAAAPSFSNPALHLNKNRMIPTVQFGSVTCSIHCQPAIALWSFFIPGIMQMRRQLPLLVHSLQRQCLASAGRIAALGHVSRVSCRHVPEGGEENAASAKAGLEVSGMQLALIQQKPSMQG